MSETDIEDMFTLADQDNDGKISYKVTWYDMILILDGNSEYAAHM